MLKKILWVVLPCMLFAAGVSHAGDLSGDDAMRLEKAGLAVYPGAVLFGRGESMTTHTITFSFATSDSVPKVLDWYKAKLKGWNVTKMMDAPIIYHGKPGLEWMDAMVNDNVVIDEDRNMHKWYDELKSDMTTIIKITLMGNVK
ncbi:MAG: hypothetical protein Q9M29_00385 [Mariprofundaceae bacterium]|nr:hypothetical protein [Mariprofundaceae bacterium]